MCSTGLTSGRTTGRSRLSVRDAAQMCGDMYANSKAGTFVRFSALQESGHIGDDSLAVLTPPRGPRRLTDGKWTSLALPSRYGLDRVDQRSGRRSAAMV